MAIIDSKQILLIMLISIVLIVIVISFQKMRLDNNDKYNVKNNVKNNNLNIENFENNNNNPENNLDELKKYMKIQGLYPMSKGVDMSKYVLKSQVDKQKACPDMSKYISKAAVPRPIKCPVINRDEWIKKSELPPNWNKECPKQPDLTNYVLKSTIPPTQNAQHVYVLKLKLMLVYVENQLKKTALKVVFLKMPVLSQNLVLFQNVQMLNLVLHHYLVQLQNALKYQIKENVQDQLDVHQQKIALNVMELNMSKFLLLRVNHHRNHQKALYFHKI